MWHRFLVLVLALAPLSSSAQVVIPDTAAGRVLSAWLEAFNSADRAQIEAYIQKHAAPSDSADAMLDFRNLTGGVELLHIESSEPRAIVYRVKELARPRHNWGRMVVSATDPPRVTSSFMRVVPPSITVTPNFGIDVATRDLVIDTLIAELRKTYVLEDKAEAMIEALTRRRAEGEYDVAYGDELSLLLTEHMRAVINDEHLNVAFSPVAFPAPPAQPAEPSPRPLAELEQMRRQATQARCGFAKLEILAGNVGYLNLTTFSADPEICGPTATTAMAFFESVDALIIDVRDNGGGDPAMAAYVSTYLFAERTHLDDLWTRSTGETEEFWTNSDLPGKRLATQRVYVLTSRRTFSGGEAFAYDLQSLKRATIVGETTRGAAHGVRTERVDDRFDIRVPFQRAINPVTKTNWQGTGVEPDVKVPAADALVKAQELLRAPARPPAPRPGA
jgi:peptidase S41-like protein